MHIFFLIKSKYKHLYVELYTYKSLFDFIFFKTPFYFETKKQNV